MAASVATLTFLFTDIEGSTKLWEQYPEAMRAALARHDAILRGAIEGHGGAVFKTVGDAFYATFARPMDAVNAALRVQADLHAEHWGEVGQIKVRVALNTGEVERREGDYFGPALNRIARLLSAGHGGQILLFPSTADEVQADLPEEVVLRDLGARRLKDLPSAEQILQLVAPGLPASFPPLRTLDKRPSNLPAQPTALVGREREVEALTRRLLARQVRLVTLTGPGGTGKTRLCLQAATNVVDDFADGVFFVPLEPLTDPALVPPTIAHVLGVRDTGGRPLFDNLKDYLREKQILILLDNFEQVAPAARAIAELLSACPGLKLLVTSRTVLRLRGEHQFPVPPLGLPDPKQRLSIADLGQFEAVRLFVERAKEVEWDFTLSAANATDVVDICRRLDGLPLAIELAAARTAILPPNKMLAQMEQRLGLLTDGALDLPERQQTMRNTIAWSYDLLAAAEQKLFEQLSVFVGGCRLEAAQVVCDGTAERGIDVLDGLTSLLGKSLVRREGSSDAPRFRMLETIREYGLERLESGGEGAACHLRHAHYFKGLAEAAEPQLTGSDQAAWLEQLETEHDNFRASLGWALKSHTPEVALQIAGAVWRFWGTRGYVSEGRIWLDRALAASRDECSPVRARALRAAGNLAWRQADYAAGQALHEEGLALNRALGDEAAIAASLNNLGGIAIYQANYAQAQALYEESLAAYQRLSDVTNIAQVTLNLGVVAEDQGDYTAAGTRYKESLALCRELGDRARTALCLYNLGLVSTFLGDYQSAQAQCEESLGIDRELGDKWNAAFALCQLGEIARLNGDYDGAEANLTESLTLQREVGDKRGIAQALERFAGLALDRGQAALGARLLGSAEAQRQASGTQLGQGERAANDRAVAAARTALGEEGFSAALLAGKAMTAEQAIAFATGEG